MTKQSYPKQHQKGASPHGPGKEPAAPVARALLTRREELDLARAIEQGERAVAEAVAGSRPALKELAALAQETGECPLDATRLMRATFREEHEARKARRQLIELVGRVRAISAQRMTAATDLERARTALVAALLRYGLHPQVVNRILAQLRDAQRAAGDSKKKTLADAIAAIERGRDRSDLRASAKWSVCGSEWIVPKS